MKKFAFLIVGAAALAGCSNLGKTVDVAITARLRPDAQNGVTVEVRGTVCGGLEPRVQVDGNRLIVTARGREANQGGTCGYALKDHPPRENTGQTTVAIPDGEYELVAGDNQTTFAVHDGIVTDGRYDDNARASVARMARERALVTSASRALVAEVPGWALGWCGLEDVDHEREMRCGFGVSDEELDAAWDSERPERNIPRGAFTAAFGCEPRQDTELFETRCDTVVDGAAITVKVDGTDIDATMEIDVKP